MVTYHSLICAHPDQGLFASQRAGKCSGFLAPMSLERKQAGHCAGTLPQLLPSESARYPRSRYDHCLSSVEGWHSSRPPGTALCTLPSPAQRCHDRSSVDVRCRRPGSHKEESSLLPAPAASCTAVASESTTTSKAVSVHAGSNVGTAALACLAPLVALPAGEI